jgi:hypothetical protein
MCCCVCSLLDCIYPTIIPWEIYPWNLPLNLISQNLPPLNSLSRSRKWIPWGENERFFSDLYAWEFSRTSMHKYLREFISIHILFSRGRGIHPFPQLSEGYVGVKRKDLYLLNCVYYINIVNNKCIWIPFKKSCWSIVSTLSTTTECQHSCFERIQSRPQELHFAICWSPWTYKMGTITSKTFISWEDPCENVDSSKNAKKITNPFKYKYETLSCYVSFHIY